MLEGENPTHIRSQPILVSRRLCDNVVENRFDTPLAPLFDSEQSSVVFL